MADEYLAANHHPACYPSTETKALRYFESALAKRAGDPKAAPLGQGAASVHVITPHIDFRVSPRAYAEAFGPLLHRPLAGTYIILGVGHRSRLEWNLDRRGYATPLGKIDPGRDMIDRLGEGIPASRLLSPEAHRGEHSIEFAAVWLQAIHRLHETEANRSFRMVPLLCGGLHPYIEGDVGWSGLDDFHRLAGNLSQILSEPPAGDVRVIVSIDGCHMGPRFQHPFRVTPALLRATAGWEEMLWACAARGDARGFLDWMREEGNDRYFDGVGALALVLAAGQGKFRPQRTYYEQWFTQEDASVVTFSSGTILTES